MASLTALPVAQVGRYPVLGELGRGGMGEVLLSYDPELGRELALKVMRGDSAERPLNVQRFREEAQVSGQLQHPGVVPVYELGRADDGRPYFTMKLVKGVTLAQLLKERSSPAQDRPRFLKVFEQVCQAVAYAHSKGVIHRDLKPANMMVGNFGEVLVMDWGLAKVLASGGCEPPGCVSPGADPLARVPQPPLAGSSVVQVSRTDPASAETQEGDVLGTPAYMAPEQALGEINRLDQRCDVFSLGAILCEVLTGLPPYAGGDRVTVLRQARRAELSEALGRLETCEADEELVDLARRCLSAEPNSRPRDASEVARAVETYLAGVEERARQAELERAPAQARGEEARVREKVERERADEAERREAVEKRARRLTLGLAASVLLLGAAGGSGAWLMQKHRAEAAARRREADEETRQALDRARQLLTTGWEKNDAAQLAEASAEADKAVTVAHRGDASEDVCDEADTLFQEVQAKAEQTTKNAALLAALLDVSTPRETKQYVRTESGQVAALAELSVDEQFAAAFRRWEPDLDLDHLPAEEVLRRLRSQPQAVVEGVVAGLEGWMLDRRQRGAKAETWQRLWGLADQLDANPQRREVRQLLGSGQLRHERRARDGLKLLLPSAALYSLGVGAGQRRLEQLASALKPGRDPVLSVISLARALGEGGDVAGAERVLRLVLAAQPDQIVLLEVLGRLLERQKRWQEAIGCYRGARALRPHLGVALADALREVGRAREAEAILRDLIDKEPDNPELWVHRGAILCDDLHRPAEAEETFRKAIELKPDLVMAHYDLGVALVAQKKLDEAVAAYKKAIDLKPDYALAYSNLGATLYHQKKLAEAIVVLRKAIQLQPNLPLAYNNLGGALYELKRLDEAVAALRKAIELQPDFADAYSNLGGALYHQKKLDEAITAYRKAVALNPKLPLAYNNLGVALRDQKQLPEAAAAFRKAHQLLPNQPLLRNNLRQTERLLELDKHLPAILAGQAKPRSPQEQVELALFCVSFKERYRAAVGLYADAFRAEPKLADDLQASHRYNAACAAALAAAGKGTDAGKRDDKERTRLRQQALDWLRVDLTAYTRLAEKGDRHTHQAVQQRLAHWQEDTDLAALRDEKALAALPAKERAAWQQLWADVAALRKRVETKE